MATTYTVTTTTDSGQTLTYSGKANGFDYKWVPDGDPVESTEGYFVLTIHGREMPERIEVGWIN